MRIPFINTDEKIGKKADQIFKKISPKQCRRLSDIYHYFNFVKIQTSEQAIEYINYQTPELIIINFSDLNLAAFSWLNKIIEDPWMNNSGIIGIYETSETFERIHQLENSNLIISIDSSTLETYLPKVFGIIYYHQHFLFQRCMQKNLVGTIQGHFNVEMDTELIPCYSNLIVNYLYNIGFIELNQKNKIRIAFIEILLNAIEHGNCGISEEQKINALHNQIDMKQFIEERLQQPEIAKKKLLFEFDIQKDHSSFTITDEGKGFDWKAKIDMKETDYFSEYGRGINIAKAGMDQMHYNEKGNSVTLKLNHKKNIASTVPLGFLNNEIIFFKKNDIVCFQEEESSDLYYIVEGEFRVEVDRIVVAYLTPVDILIGEMSFLLENKRSASVIANSNSKLIKISKESFINLIKKQPYYGLFLAKLLAQKLHKMTLRTIH